MAATERWRRYLIATAIGSVAWSSYVIDPRLRARIDASDVLQEAFIDVARDLDAYLADPKLPPLLWLRLHVGRRLTTLYRQHLGTQMRDAGMEISLYRDALPEASSRRPWPPCSWENTRLPPRPPSVQNCCYGSRRRSNSLDPIEREILGRCTLEQLSRPQTADVLGISQEAGAKRYFRALKRLSKGSFSPCPAEARGSRSWRTPHRADRAPTGSSTSWPEEFAVAATDGVSGLRYRSISTVARKWSTRSASSSPRARRGGAGRRGSARSLRPVAPPRPQHRPCGR